MTTARTDLRPMTAVGLAGGLVAKTELRGLTVKVSEPPASTAFFDFLSNLVGVGNILEGWKLDETSGNAIGVRGVANMTPGVDVIAQGQATGVTPRPLAAEVRRASPGAAFDAGDVGILDFDWSTDAMSVIFWAKMDGTAASGLFGKQAVLASTGYQACLRPDVNPDIMQWRARDSSNLVTAFIQDNAVSDDAWHMWTFINDPSVPELRLHLDNGSAATADTSVLGDGSNAGSLLIGDDLSFQSMQGELNHVYFLSFALSQTQVNQLFAAG